MSNPYDPNKYDMGAKNVISGLKTDVKLQEAVTKKKKQKQGSGDPYLDLQRDQFNLMKKNQQEQKEAMQQSAMTQGILGGAQSGIQTAFGSQTQDQALGGALTTGLQLGMATGNPYVGAAAALGSFFMGSRSARKAENKRRKAEAEQKRQQKLANMRAALGGYQTQRQMAMNSLMNVLS